MNKRRTRQEPLLSADDGYGAHPESEPVVLMEAPPIVKTIQPVAAARPRQPVTEAVNPPAEPVSVKRSMVITIATLMLALVIVALVVDRVLHPDAFRLSKVHVEGELRNVNGEAVRAMADVALQSDSGSNFFSVDLVKMERALEQVPWVAKASVRRRWPDTLKVQIIEANPVAQWNDEEWIAQTGRLIKFSEAQTPQKPLPLLIGPQGQHETIWRQYKQWAAKLEQAGLNIKSLELSSRHAWKLKVFENQRVASNEDLTVAKTVAKSITSDDAANTSDIAVQDAAENNETVLLLGKDNLDERFERFINGYKNSLRNDFYRVTQIDLRYPNGLALRWSQDKLNKGDDKALAKDGGGSKTNAGRINVRLRKDPATGKNKQTSA